MGLQPLVRNMPLRITQTDHKRKDKRLFKTSRCTLFGWELHAVDQQRFEHNSTLQFVLQHMPVCLYVRIFRATWVENEKLGAGLAQIKPTYIVWALDKKWTTNRKTWFHHCFRLQWHRAFISRIKYRGCNCGLQ